MSREGTSLRIFIGEKIRLFLDASVSGELGDEYRVETQISMRFPLRVTM